MRVPELSWRRTAEVEIQIEGQEEGGFFIYDGTSRENSTLKYNATVGAYRVPVDDGAIIVFMTKPVKFKKKNYNGSGSFTITISGQPYPFYEVPFLGHPWYLMNITLAILSLLIILTTVLSICYCRKKKAEKKALESKPWFEMDSP